MDTLRAKYANALENEFLICFESEEEAKSQIQKWQELEKRIKHLEETKAAGR